MQIQRLLLLHHVLLVSRNHDSATLYNRNALLLKHLHVLWHLSWDRRESQPVLGLLVALVAQTVAVVSTHVAPTLTQLLYLTNSKPILS